MILGGLAAAGVATVGGYFAWQRYSFGDFQIASTPPGVPVTMDGLAIGNTPVTGRARVGQHNLSIPAMTTDPSTGRSIPFTQWLDGVMTADRTIDIVPSGQGDYLGNSFLATYSATGSIGHIPAIVNVNGPTANSQFISVKAYKTSASCGPIPLFNCCNLKYKAFGEWTGSDYEASIIVDGLLDSAGNGWYVPSLTDAQKFTATVLDTVGKPIPNVSVLFWWDNPVVASAILGYTLYRLSTDTYGNEINLGAASTPFVRTTDSNGNATLNVLPLLSDKALSSSLSYLGSDYGGNGSETSSCASIIDGCGPPDNSRLPFTTDKSNTGISCPFFTTGGFYYCLLRAGVLHDTSNPVIDTQFARLSAQVAAAPLIRNLASFQITTKLAAKSPA